MKIFRLIIILLTMSLSACGSNGVNPELDSNEGTDSLTSTNTLIVEAPTSNKESGKYESTLTVELKAEGDVYYTLNGLEPDYVNGTKYESPIVLSSTTTINAIAYVEENNEMVSSEVKTWIYTISEEEEHVSSKKVKSYIKSGGLIIFQPLTVSQIKEADVVNTTTDNETKVEYALLNYYDAKNECELGGGQLPTDLYKISKAYGSKNDSSGDGINSGGFAVRNEEMVEDIGWVDYPMWDSKGFGFNLYFGISADWYEDTSEMEEGLYLVSCTSEIKASKKSGQYDSPITVDLNVKGNIYYTLDGSDPTEASALYNEAISINKSSVLKILIVNDDGSVTRLDDYVYEIRPVAPTSSKEPGTYDLGVDVALSGEGTIYYTLDSTIPTTESTIYSSEISITKDTTIKAIVVKDGLQSEVSVWEYKIK
jgi:hypothetical protein